jgi:hypothetical protein
VELQGESNLLPSFNSSECLLISRVLLPLFNGRSGLSQYSELEALELFEKADLRIINSWKAPDSEYRLWLLERPLVRFTPIMSEDQVETKIHEAKGVPKWSEWLDLWKLWDQ